MSTVIRRPELVGAVTVAGRTMRVDLLTVAELDALDAAPTVKIVAALLHHAGIDPDTIRWVDVAVFPVEDDRPDTYSDGCPVSGGRAMDVFITMFARPPWCWPPDVTRRQTIRDLQLILTALEAQ